MNDFTKEELCQMLAATITLSFFYKPDLMDSIRKKLVTLIDNYQEDCDLEKEHSAVAQLVER